MPYYTIYLYTKLPGVPPRPLPPPKNVPRFLALDSSSFGKKNYTPGSSSE